MTWLLLHYGNDFPGTKRVSGRARHAAEGLDIVAVWPAGAYEVEYRAGKRLIGGSRLRLCLPSLDIDECRGESLKRAIGIGIVRERNITQQAGSTVEGRGGRRLLAWSMGLSRPHALKARAICC